VCVLYYYYYNAYKEWQTLVCVDDWSNVVVGDGGSSGSNGVLCCAEGMGRAGPWNKSIPNGRETDGREKGGLAAECHSAPADIVLRVYVFFFVFNSNSSFILFYILLHRRVSFSLFGRPALTLAPFVPSSIHLCFIYKCSSPTEIFTLKKQLFN